MTKWRPMTKPDFADPMSSSPTTVLRSVRRRMKRRRRSCCRRDLKLANILPLPLLRIVVVVVLLLAAPHHHHHPREWGSRTLVAASAFFPRMIPTTRTASLLRPVFCWCPTEPIVTKQLSHYHPQRGGRVRLATSSSSSSVSTTNSTTTTGSVDQALALLARQYFGSSRCQNRATASVREEPLSSGWGSVGRPFLNTGPMDATTTTPQTTLVRLGFAFAAKQMQHQQQPEKEEEQPFDPRRPTSPWSKVPGCLATVHIQTRLRTVVRDPSPPSTDDNDTDDIERRRTSLTPREFAVFVVEEIRGTADAHLSRGLVACLAMALRDCPGPDVLQLDPNTLADKLGLAAVLSPGRNNGLSSMLTTIQQQIRHCLEQQQQQQDEDYRKQHGQWIDTGKTMPATTTTTGANTNPLATLKEQRQPTVALLLSGGVDSSVALNLLVRDIEKNPQSRYNVTAFYLKIWLADELSHLGECPWEDDYMQCVAVCQQLNVPLETISLQSEYQQKVISYTVAEAQAGRTPNPDILCNSRIKFGCFYEAVADRNFDFVATGHYAQLIRSESSHAVMVDVDDERDVEDDKESGRLLTNPVRLLRAPDPVKDQSYFLCALTQEQLQRVLFPIGHLQKSEVRALAEQWKLPNRHRPDSQGLCFLGKIKFNDFLGSYLPDRPGPIVDAATGERLGTHRGVWYHTVGQRKGLGKVLTPTATSKGPWYVVAKDPATDSVFCSNQYDEDIFTSSRSNFTVENIHWISGHAPLSLLASTRHALNGDILATSHDSIGAPDDVSTTCRLLMKIRHGPKLVGGVLTCWTASQSIDGISEVDVCLEEKDSGLAPGQFVAFYIDEECLGGGVISERQWTKFLWDSHERRSLQASHLYKESHANL